MRILYLACLIVDALIFCVRGLATAYDVVTDLIMTPFRADYGNARRFVNRFLVSAFRFVGPLKPEYEESLETDGLSLPVRRAGQL